MIKNILPRYFFFFFIIIIIGAENRRHGAFDRLILFFFFFLSEYIYWTTFIYYALVQLARMLALNVLQEIGIIVYSWAKRIFRGGNRWTSNLSRLASIGKMARVVSVNISRSSTRQSRLTMFYLLSPPFPPSAAAVAVAVTATHKTPLFVWPSSAVYYCTMAHWQNDSRVQQRLSTSGRRCNQLPIYFREFLISRVHTRKLVSPILSTPATFTIHVCVCPVAY